MPSLQHKQRPPSRKMPSQAFIARCAWSQSAWGLVGQRKCPGGAGGGGAGKYRALGPKAHPVEPYRELL